MLSGSRALEFLGNQGVTALGNLVLSRQDSLLLDVRSTVPAEEVARLRYDDLPSSPGIFPSPLLDSALNKMHAASNDALVQWTLHPPKIPRKSSAGPSKAGSSSTASDDRGGTCPVIPRSQKQASTAPSSSSTQQGRKKRGRKGKAPFSGASVGSGRSEGKRQEKLLHISLLEMKALFLALQSFQELVAGRRVTAMCDNSTVVAYVNKQGGPVSRSLCSLASQIRKWSESLNVHFDVRYLPGQSNVLADLLSHRDQVIETEWSLPPQVARALLHRRGSPSIDLFATSLRAKLPLYCSLVPDPQAVFEDAFRHPWDNLDLYAFPPFPLVGRVVARVRETPNLSMTLVAPSGQRKSGSPTFYFY